LPVDARDCDRSVLQRLPKRLECRARELGQLVEKEHALVSQGRFAGSRTRSAAGDRSSRGGVMRRAQRRPLHKRPARREQACDGVNARHLEGLLHGESRKQAGQPPREHRLPRAGWACEQHVVAPCRRDLERAPAALLPSYRGEIGPARLRR
jgi:hypothetical protein